VGRAVLCIRNDVYSGICPVITTIGGLRADLLQLGIIGQISCLLIGIAAVKVGFLIVQIGVDLRQLFGDISAGPCDIVVSVLENRNNQIRRSALGEKVRDPGYNICRKLQPFRNYTG
jgi:hypothetical protein